MKIAINQAEYSNTSSGPVVHIFGREEDGTGHELKITGFRPYFWVARRKRPKIMKPALPSRTNAVSR
jgi:hypothetical protein